MTRVLNRRLILNNEQDKKILEGKKDEKNELSTSREDGNKGTVKIIFEKKRKNGR